MASIISAGTTSATALNMSADTTGVLQLASNNGVVALTVDTSQNVGVNSTGTIRTKFMVSSSNASDTLTVGSVSGGFSITNTNNAYGLQFGSLSTGNSWIQSARMDGTATAYNLLLQPGGGNVGVNCVPAVALDVTRNQNALTALNVFNNDSTNASSIAAIRVGYDSTYHYSISRVGNSADIIQNATQSGAPVVWQQAGAERLRLNTNGYFKASADGVYVDTNGFYHEMRGGATNGYTLIVTSPLASPASQYVFDIRFSGASPNNGSARFWNVTDSSATRGYFLSNGGLANYQANNGNLSDRREKTNFAPAKPYLDVICSIPVQTFNYIDQNMEEDGGLTLGVVAQDVQEVAPELVTETNWGTEEEPKMRLSIYQTDLQYALMKSIQELNAKVTALEEQVLNLGVK